MYMCRATFYIYLFRADFHACAGLTYINLYTAVIYLYGALEVALTCKYNLFLFPACPNIALLMPVESCKWPHVGLQMPCFACMFNK